MTAFAAGQRFHAVAARRAGGVPRQAGGFTLIELLVAVSLLAVLAVLSWRGLDAVLQSRDRLVQESNELRSLTLALSQLEEDLLQTWPVRNLHSRIVPVQVPLRSKLQAGSGGGDAGQSIILVREISRTGLPTRIQRVVYQVRDGQLARGFSEWQQGSSSGGVGGAVQSLVWQPILQGVQAIHVRGWAGDLWLGGQQLAQLTSSPDAALGGGTIPEENSTTPDELRANFRAMRERAIVRGLEVTIERSDGQRFYRIYSTQD